MGLQCLSCLLLACSCPENRSASVKCSVSDLAVELGSKVRMGQCPGSLARHCGCTGAGARAAGLRLEAVAGHSHPT